MPITADHASWDDYDARLAELFPPLDPGDGIAESEIAAAEERLASCLPKVLREHYLRAGQRSDINQSFNRLALPGSLRISGDALVFYADSDGATLWGIRLDELEKDDPPVVRSTDDETVSWHADHPHLSGFLVAMLYWQAVHGGMPYTGTAQIDETEIPALRNHWPRVELMGWFAEHTMVFHKAGQALCVVGHAPDLALRAGGRTRKDFLAIQERLNLDWDFSTLDTHEPG